MLLFVFRGSLIVCVAWRFFTWWWFDVLVLSHYSQLSLLILFFCRWGWGPLTIKFIWPRYFFIQDRRSCHTSLSLHLVCWVFDASHFLILVLLSQEVALGSSTHYSIVMLVGLLDPKDNLRLLSFFWRHTLPIIYFFRQTSLTSKFIRRYLYLYGLIILYLKIVLLGLRPL